MDNENEKINVSKENEGKIKVIKNDGFFGINNLNKKYGKLLILIISLIFIVSISLIFNIYAYTKIGKIELKDREYIDGRYGSKILKNFKLIEGFFGSGDELFINSLIRLYKPKKILEIGVYRGTSSSVILNAIKDIEGSFLYSCDIEKMDFIQGEKRVDLLLKNIILNL